MDIFEHVMSIWVGQEVLVSAICVALFSSIVMLFTLKKQNHLLAQINKLSEELQVANRGAIGMGQQIIALEKKLEAMSVTTSPIKEQTPVATTTEESTDKKVANTSAEPNTQAIENSKEADDKLALARDLLAKGQSLSEVASHCQLSFAEVSLLRALNPNNNAPQNQSPTH